jgi:uncharacterized protein with FMN-binding domain
MPNVSRSDRGEFSRVPRRGAVALVATVTGLVLLISFHTPDDSTLGQSNPPPLGAVGLATPPPTTIPRQIPASTQTVGATPSGAPPRPDRTMAVPRPTDSPASNGQQVIDGPEVDNPYGPVQVEVTVQGQKLVDAQALQLPTDRRTSRQISQYVEPILRDEALRAQSANIDIISGATFTSEAYARSLQAALDSAHR